MLAAERHGNAAKLLTVRAEDRHGCLVVSVAPWLFQTSDDRSHSRTDKSVERVFLNRFEHTKRDIDRGTGVAALDHPAYLSPPA